MRTRDIPWVKDLLKRIPKERRKEVLDNLCKAREEMEDNNFLNECCTSLSMAFIWAESPQGFNYWDTLDAGYRGY